MFRCESCGGYSKPCDKPVRTVTALRQHRHPPRTYRRRKGEDRCEDAGGVGMQIVREAVLCRDCAGSAPEPSVACLPVPGARVVITSTAEAISLEFDRQFARDVLPEATT